LFLRFAFYAFVAVNTLPVFVRFIRLRLPVPDQIQTTNLDLCSKTPRRNDCCEKQMALLIN